MKDSQDDKLMVVIGTVLAIAIVGAVVCGILECFGINTSWVGGVLAIIPLLFLAVFVVWQIIGEITK